MDLLKFWEISAEISEMVQDRDRLQWKTNRKLHVSYRMAPTSVTFSVTLAVLNLSNCYSSMNMTGVNYVVCIHEWESICGL